MGKNCILILLVFCQSVVFAQDKKVMKIAKYIEKGKGTEAKELLDELDGQKEYETDIYYWYVRAIYYRNVVLSNHEENDLIEARKSLEKLVKLDKKNPNNSLSQYIPQLRKDLNEANSQPARATDSRLTTENQPVDDGKTVTLTQIGKGRTKDEAKYNALRNSIEKAFGTFISSNTTLLNDELVKNEIVSLSSGNIQNFEILSETQMPDGSFSSVVKATVSIIKLTSFCESKGITVEFKGGVFAANVKIQELNKKNEEAVMEELFTILNNIVSKGFDYKINVSEPRKDDYNDNNWIVDFWVTAFANENLENIKQITLNTINNICLSPQDITAYSNQNINTYKIKINDRDYYFRSPFSIIYIRTIFEKKIPLASLNFSVSDGINTSDCVSMLPSKLNQFPGQRWSARELGWPCISSSNSNCGYDGAIKAKYFILYNNTGSELNNDISKFLLSINNGNFYEITNSYCSYGSDRIPVINLDQFNSKEVAKYNNRSHLLEIMYCFSNTYSMEQLEQITEYKVQPK